MMNMAIEINLTLMIIVCITFVFSMLLKLNRAPLAKKMTSQNLKSSKISGALTSVKTLERILPVMIHFEMHVPVK